MSLCVCSSPWVSGPPLIDVSFYRSESRRRKGASLHKLASVFTANEGFCSRSRIYAQILDLGYLPLTSNLECVIIRFVE